MEAIYESIQAHETVISALKNIKKHVIDDDIMESVDRAIEDLVIEVESIKEELSRIVNVA